MTETRLKFVGLSLVLTLGTALAGQKEVNPREIGMPRGRVSFQNIGGVIVIPVRLNGSRPLHMILDTGMSAGVIVLFHSELGQEIGLKYAQGVVMAGAGGDKARQTAQLAVGVEVTIGDIVQPNKSVVVSDEKRQDSLWSFDGVIGKSLFDAHIVEIDYQQSLLVFHDPAQYTPENPETAIPLSLKNGMPVIEAMIDSELEKDIPLKLVIDLGNRNMMVFNVQPSKKICFPRRTLSAVIGRGVLGELTGKVGRLPKLRIGPFLLQEIIAAFAPEEGNTGARPAGSVFDGNLGYGLLKEFRVVFDYPHQRLFLIPQKEDFPPFEYNMLGISFEQRMDRSLLVRSVIDGSPAAQKGIQAGDVIIALNGKGLEGCEFGDVDRLLQEPNKKIKVSLKRDEKLIHLRLTLRRLI